jgi:hypothetical protein
MTFFAAVNALPKPESRKFPVFSQLAGNFTSETQSLFGATVVLIEDKASGTQLIQELIADGCHGVTRYQPTCDKIMRLNAQTAMIDNGDCQSGDSVPDSTSARF